MGSLPTASHHTRRTSVYCSCCLTFLPILILIGIQEDVLNMFLITHFLLLFSCGGLVFVFSLLLCLRMNPNFKSSLPRSGGWFGGQARRVQQQQPVYVEEPRQRRGWFQRN